MTATKKNTKKSVVKNTKSNPPGLSVLSNDFKNALLITSILINVAIFIGWVAIRVTNVYDDQVLMVLFGGR